MRMQTVVRRTIFLCLLLLIALSAFALPVWAEEGAALPAAGEAAPESTEMPAPQVWFSRDFSSRYAEYGDQITLSYTVQNDGQLPIENVLIQDTLVGEVGTVERIEPGERKRLNVRVQVTQSCSSQPTLTYDCAGQSYTETRSAESISLADVNLQVRLEADKTSVAPGEMVTLRLLLTNQGDVRLYGLHGSEPVLGEMGSLVSALAPGEEYTVTRTVQMKSTGTFQFTVEGSSDTGGAISVQSNEMSVLVTPVAAEIQLSLRAEADQTELYGPGKVAFSLYVDNECSLELRNVSLSEETRGDIRQLAFVPTGEMPVIIQEYEISESGTYRFRAQVTDSVGDVLTVYSEPIEIAVLEERESASPSPEPTVQATQMGPSASPGVIPVLDGSPYRMEENPATFEKLMAGTVFLLLTILFIWYVVDKFKRWSARRRRARQKRKQKKNRNGTRKK